MQIRTPAVAGMFYPDERSELKKSIHECFVHRLGPGRDLPPSPPPSPPPPGAGTKIFGAICPHAGYEYSGPVACHSFHAMSPAPPGLFVVVGPNHWGIGRDVATMRDCKWRTPLGDVEVDSEAAEEISGLSDTIEVDYFSHTREHSIEVQLPMIQELSSDARIVPISMISQDKDSSDAVGLAVASVAGKRDAMIIGSSDFTHYEPNEFAHEQDKALIEPVLELDVDSFYDVLEERKVSACGYGAIASTMAACKKLGAVRGELLKYATSGDVTGDMSSVVGYGAIVFT